MLSVACALLLGAAGGLGLRSVAFGLLAAVIGAALPVGYVYLKRHERLEKLRGQLPDAFDLMSRVLRAGQTVSQAMQCVADEFTRPISLEFLYCSEQMNLGLSPDAALRELGRRTGMLEIKIFVLAVTVHRQTGGNLAELLDKLAHVVRERARIQGMIRSLTAQGRFQAGILLSLPPAMFLLLMVVDPKYEMILLQYPAMIALALGLMLAGAWWVKRIVSFEF
jgi:tight adherence protein B